MPGYRYKFAASARRDIKKLDLATQRRLAKKMQFFISQSDPAAYAKPLIHSKLGSYRFRVGHYRIVFDIKDDNIMVLSVKHRRDVYR